MDNDKIISTLEEIAMYFSNCYMNAAHGQGRLKFQRYINAVKYASASLQEHRFSAEEVAVAMIKAAHKDTRFKFGDTICYKPSEVLDILIDVENEVKQNG